MEIKKVNILSGNVDFANGKKARFVYLLCKCFLPRIARINTDYFIALQKDSLLKDRERNHLNNLCTELVEVSVANLFCRRQNFCVKIFFCNLQHDS